MTTTLANIGSVLSPLVGMTSELYPSLPLFTYGAVLVATCPIPVLLPEILGLSLPNTLQDVERRYAARSPPLPILRAIRPSQILDPAPFNKKRPDPGESRDLPGVIQLDSGGATARIQASCFLWLLVLFSQIG